MNRVLKICARGGERGALSPSILLSLLLLGASIFLSNHAFADDARIFVIHEADGTIRFTNRMPPPGVEAQVFRARAHGFTYMRGGSAAARSRTNRLYPDKYTDEIHAAAREHRVDPALIKAVIHAESAFNPRALSRKGAMGLMQLMPSTARMMGVRNAFKPESNIHGGTSYLAKLLRRYRNVEHALAAYNAGDLPVQRYNGIPPFSETQEYVRRVLQLKKQYSTTSHG